MSVSIPDRILDQAGISEPELLLKMAVMLFQEERLTLGQASKLAGLHQIKFQQELARHRIPIHYGIEEFKLDLETISELK